MAQVVGRVRIFVSRVAAAKKEDAPMSTESSQVVKTLCLKCRGAGVITISDGPFEALMREGGVFCTHCEEGKQRWQATLKAIQECERPLTRRPGLPGPEPKVFMVG